MSAWTGSIIHVIGLWVVAVWVAVITTNMVIEGRRHPDEKPFAPTWLTVVVGIAAVYQVTYAAIVLGGQAATS